MKRLLDEETDELTRSLLSAGVEHRPPPGNKAHVIVALGAGGALGMLSSNAFAWLGTTAGKVTAVSVVAVGVAGAVLATVPGADTLADNREGRARSTLSAPASTRPDAQGLHPQGLHPQGSTPAATGPSPAVTPAAAANADDSAEPGTDDATTLDPASSDEAPSRASEHRARPRARHARRKAREARAESVEAAAAEAEATPAAEPSAAASAPAATDALDSEVRLVDDMHWAARRNDRTALARFVERYRADFPDGQLKKEVEQFADRLQQTDAP